MTLKIEQVSVLGHFYVMRQEVLFKKLKCSAMSPSFEKCIAELGVGMMCVCVLVAESLLGMLNWMKLRGNKTDNKPTLMDKSRTAS